MSLRNFFFILILFQPIIRNNVFLSLKGVFEKKRLYGNDFFLIPDISFSVVFEFIVGHP